MPPNLTVRDVLTAITHLVPRTLGASDAEIHSLTLAMVALLDAVSDEVSGRIFLRGPESELQDELGHLRSLLTELGDGANICAYELVQLSLQRLERLAPPAPAQAWW